MGTDYYSYVTIGVCVDDYIEEIKYEEKTPSCVWIDGKEENVFDKEGKAIFDVEHKRKWKFNDDDYTDLDDLGNYFKSIGLRLVTQGCEEEIWDGDVIGIIISESEVGENASIDIESIQERLKEVEDVLKSVGVNEKPIVRILSHISY